MKSSQKNGDDDEILETKFDSALIKKVEPVSVMRKEVIRRAIVYLVEEVGIPFRGENRKGRIVADDGSGKIVMSFGYGDQALEESLKMLANSHVMAFMMTFNELWQKDFKERRVVTEEEAQQFLLHFK